MYVCHSYKEQIKFNSKFKHNTIHNTYHKYQNIHSLYPTHYDILFFCAFKIYKLKWPIFSLSDCFN